MKLNAFSAILFLVATATAASVHKNEGAVSSSEDEKNQLEAGAALELDQEEGTNGKKEFTQQDDEENEEHQEYDDADELDNYEFLLKLFENSQETDYVEEIDDYEQVLADTLLNNGLNLNVTRNGRELISLPSVHCNCPSQQHYFNVEITVRPQAYLNLYWCNSYWKWKMGRDINSMLLDMGVGPAGVGDNVVFLARVCENPTVQNFRRELLDDSQHDGQDHHDGNVEDIFAEEHLFGSAEEQGFEAEDEERELWAQMSPTGFMYPGGGPCRGCPYDNHDHRRRQRERKTASTLRASCSGSSCTTSINSISSGGDTSISTSCYGPNCNTMVSSCITTGLPCQCTFDMIGFLRNLNDRIRTYMLNTVVPNNPKCAGVNPHIGVSSRATSWPSNVNFGC